MTTVIKCDVCGKTAQSSSAFASLSIDAYQLESDIKDVDKEACSVACMAKLLRGIAYQLDPIAYQQSIIGTDASEPEFEVALEATPAKKPGFFARLFG